MHPGVQSEVHPRSPLQLLLKFTCLVFWTKKNRSAFLQSGFYLCLDFRPVLKDHGYILFIFYYHFIDQGTPE